MKREEAIKFWKFRYENAKDYTDPHWEAPERREHREYVEALRMAIEALSEPNKAVPPSLTDVYKWERDIALSQLEEYGIGFAEKKRDDLVEVVRCKDCKYRPHLENENGSDYGFNVSGDEMCPCVNKDDGWYSWMPKDNFYCGFGERKGGDDE